VIVPLEQQINGVEGMTYMTSSATNTGGANISVYFGVGTNPDIAAVDVQNRVSAATSLLPQSVTQNGVTVRKQQSSNLLILSLYSDKPGYDQTFLQNYAAINILPQLQRVNGVGSAAVTGSTMTYSMRIWLKPDLMAVYKITPRTSAPPWPNKTSRPPPVSSARTITKASNMSSGIAASSPPRLRNSATSSSNPWAAANTSS
jgi:HAE1 family hydrophobic/amphiphilic exporter-1